jgi:hypothetical protein
LQKPTSRAGKEITMGAKRKNQTSKQNLQAAVLAKQRFAQAQLAHAKGAICTEDYIWSAMQCYAAELHSGQKPHRRFA